MEQSELRSMQLKVHVSLKPSMVLSSTLRAGVIHYHRITTGSLSMTRKRKLHISHVATAQRSRPLPLPYLSSMYASRTASLKPIARPSLRIGPEVLEGGE